MADQTAPGPKQPLQFGDERQITTVHLLEKFGHEGEGPEGLCVVCYAPLETVGDVQDGICGLCALLPPDRRDG